MGRTLASVLVAVAVVATSCDAGEQATSTTSAAASTPPVASIAPATEPTGPAVATSTSPSPSSVPTTQPAATVPSTAPPTSFPTDPTCATDEAVRILDATIELARLTPAGPWTDRTDGVAFDDRTDTAEGFAAMVAYDCVLRLAQRSETGDERLALIGWNELRHVLVIQATDPPTRSYRTDVVFQLLLEQPYGEWLEDQFVWAATMAGGESIIIGTRDASTALTAKSWQSEIPPFEDLPVTLESEQFGIDALVAVGARNVSVAEPASYGYPIGTLQLHTPLSLIAFAVVGPIDSFDPMVPIVADGETTHHTVDGVTIRLTTGKELGRTDLNETGWSCADHAWRLYSSYGTPQELLEFTETVVGSLDC